MKQKNEASRSKLNNRLIPEEWKQKFSDAVLDECRTRGDILADSIVFPLLEAGVSPGRLWETIRERARRRPEAGADSLADRCREFLEVTHTRPTWVEPEKFVTGKERSLQNVLPSGLSLLTGSLVESYTSARGAKVLIRTGRLRGDILARIYETAQFVQEIVTSRGPWPGEAAFDSIMRVRLLHSSVRFFILKQPDWNREEWGYPVNMEDYAGTLNMFSHVFIRGLEKLGVAVSREHRASTHHIWRYVGYLMGVDVSLLTASPEEELYQYERICRRQQHPDEDSRILAGGVLKALAWQAPFFMPEEALFAMSRRLLGDELCDKLEFPKTPVWDGAVTGLTGAFQAWDGSVRRLPLSAMGGWVAGGGRWFSQAVLWYGMSGERAPFAYKQV